MASPNDINKQILTRLDIPIRLLSHRVALDYETIETKAHTLKSLGLPDTEVARICGKSTLSIREVSKALDLEIPEQLGSFLKAHKIHSLDDIRRIGGLGRLEGLPLATDNPTVKMLNGQANLSTLPTTVEENARIIAKGYDSLSAIAAVPRKKFIRAVGIGRPAEGAHASARASQKLVDSLNISPDIANRQVPM